MFVKIIPAPVGMLNINEIINPAKNAKIEITPEIIINALNPDAKFFALTAGKIITPDIKSVPIIRIPETTINAVKSEIIIW